LILKFPFSIFERSAQSLPSGDPRHNFVQRAVGNGIIVIMMSAMVAASGESLLPPGRVLHCSTEEEYYTAIDNAGDKLVVVDCFAEWYV
jgi:hypothetical protein